MKSKRGLSLVETLLAVTVMGLVIAAGAELTAGVGRSYDRTSNQLDVDKSASQAIQWMTRDLQEAKQVDLLTTSRLRVYYPLKEPGGEYNRLLLDDVNTLDYYRGDSNGNVNAAGDCLIRDEVGSTPRVVCRGVTEVFFESTNPSSVDITLRVVRVGQVRTTTCDMIHRAIFLRNY